jgi:hypothetical protein
MTDIDIFFSDLRPAAQRRLLDAFKIDDPAEMNWDVIGIAMITTDDESSCGDE